MMTDLPPLPHVFSQQLDVARLVPDTSDERPLVSALPQALPLGFGALLGTLNAGGAALEKAAAAENAFAAGTGGLQEMVFERAKADSIVSVAAAASSRAAQSLNALVQMQL